MLGAAHTHLQNEIANRFHQTIPGSTLRIDFSCDGLGGEIREIDFTRGWGHGFSLQLFRFTLGTDIYAIHGLRFSSMARGPDGSASITIVEGTAESTQLARALAIVRAALSTSVEEVAPPPSPNQGLGLSGSFSSNDFHVAMQVNDGNQRIRARFSGYESSSDQTSFLPLQIAAEALAPFVDNLAPMERPVATTERALFAEHFTREAPFFFDEYNWWVKDRYVVMAKTLGTPTLIPDLLLLLRDTDEPNAVENRRSALDALAAITRWDPRTAGDRTISDGEAAAAYRQACAP